MSAPPKTLDDQSLTSDLSSDLAQSSKTGYIQILEYQTRDIPSLPTDREPSPNCDEWMFLRDGFVP